MDYHHLVDLPRTTEPSPKPPVSLKAEDEDKFDSWEDNELDQPGLPPAEPTNPANSAIVQAKVKQVMRLIESYKDEYANPKTPQARKDSILEETLALSTKPPQAPGFDFELCKVLYTHMDPLSQKESFYRCPEMR